MPSSATLKAIDETGEATRFGFKMVQMTSANFDAQVALLNALQVAVDNVVLGQFDGKTLNAVDVPVGPAASDKDAQRESKWRVAYTDDVTPLGNGSFEIGMTDNSLLVAGEGIMDITGGAGAALVTAIQNAVISRQGNAITVTRISHVGRNV